MHVFEAFNEIVTRRECCEEGVGWECSIDRYLKSLLRKLFGRTKIKEEGKVLVYETSGAADRQQKSLSNCQFAGCALIAFIDHRWTRSPSPPRRALCSFIHPTSVSRRSLFGSPRNMRLATLMKCK
ncbi:hypothetical protein CEXT_487061 [Caerostris extrusa]|uniref:Uncharacterized protein n=1 Tax=Caerostris extrusa TaxID=172846 RepID=A0AAV4MGQ6_CAEEX|nr:hypothetical protein CEXT_487061 [Caerostris extrusa]